MITRYEHRKMVWVDVERPTPEDVESLITEYKLGPIIEQEILTPTAKPRVDLFPAYVYAVLHFPASRDTHGRAETHEVDLIVGKDLVITVHYESVPAILDFARSFETAMLLRRDTGVLHSGHILFELSTRLYRSVEDELDAIEDSVSAIQSSIFEGKEKELVKPISVVTRELLSHKRTIANQEEVLREFEGASATLLGDNVKSEVQTMSSLHYRAHGRAQMLLDTLSELRDTNNSLLTTRQNEIMKNLTILAFVTFPLTLISSMFGMNAEHLPLVGTPGDFWIIISFMALLALSFFAYFKYKRWF